MTTKRRPEKSHGLHSALVRAFFHALARLFRGNSRGAASVEQALLLSVAVTGAAGFSQFGKNLHDQLGHEAEHIEGKGMPGSGDLGDLTANFDAPEQACPGGLCSSGAPPCSGCTSSPVTGGGPGADNPIASIAPVAAVVGAAGLALVLTPEQKNDREAACRTALEESNVAYKLLLTGNRQPAWRKEELEAKELLCKEMADECPADVSTESCVEKWTCIYELVAVEPWGRYFDTERGKNRLDRRCSDPDRQITRWACRKDAVVPPVESGEAIALTHPLCTEHPRADVRARQEQIVQSENAGEDRMKSFFAANFPGYTCGTWNGSNVFDGVCWNDAGDVIIVEAKGRRRPGTRDLGDRRGPDGGYVQQGTAEYVRGVADAMSKSNSLDGARRSDCQDPENPRDGGPRVSRNAAAAAVLAALGSSGRQPKGTLRYFEIRQELVGSDPTDTEPGGATIREFDLGNENSKNKNCRPPEQARGVQ